MIIASAEKNESRNSDSRSPASLQITHPNDEIGPQTRRKDADSTLVRQGFATKDAGLYRHPKTKTAKAQTTSQSVTKLDYPGIPLKKKPAFAGFQG